jgi:hypothetical protein
LPGKVNYVIKIRDKWQAIRPPARLALALLLSKIAAEFAN